jgi:hypothetical protein
LQLSQVKKIIYRVELQEPELVQELVPAQELVQEPVQEPVQELLLASEPPPSSGNQQ